VLIHEIHLLPQLLGEIMIPKAVQSELAHAEAPSALRQWIALPPRWLTIQPVEVTITPELNKLHAGEQEAIMLAHHINADLVLLDEKFSRQIATAHGLNVTGLLGILDRAASRGMLNLVKAVERLGETNFRIKPLLLKKLLEKHGF
jgi:predicted nucleic acid-binding protein